MGCVGSSRRVAVDRADSERRLEAEPSVIKLPPINKRQIDESHFEVYVKLDDTRLGPVHVCRQRERHSWWALKVISKAKVVPYHIRGVVNERKVLAQIKGSSPFFIELGYAFQDRRNLYRVTEFCSGGSFRSYLDAHQTMSVPMVRMYTAELLSALHTLHGLHNIIHRNITTSSIFFAPSGHLKLSSFMHCEKLEASQNFVTRGKVGTRGYVAPEILAGDMYTFDADIWSLGVTVYELLHGRRPLPHDREEFITSDFKLELDESLPKPAKDFLRATICFDRKQRVRISKLKELAWFDDIDWAQLRQCAYKPEFTPHKFRYSRRHQVHWPGRPPPMPQSGTDDEKRGDAPIKNANYDIEGYRRDNAPNDDYDNDQEHEKFQQWNYNISLSDINNSSGSSKPKRTRTKRFSDRFFRRNKHQRVKMVRTNSSDAVLVSDHRRRAVPQRDNALTSPRVLATIHSDKGGTNRAAQRAQQAAISNRRGGRVVTLTSAASHDDQGKALQPMPQHQRSSSSVIHRSASQPDAAQLAEYVAATKQRF